MTILRKGSPEEAGMRPEQIALIRERSGQWVASGKHQCIVLLVARHGVVCLHEAWGKLGPQEDAAPAKPDSIFWMASNSKPVTATAAMMLVEDGLLSLNRPAKDYIPELRGDGIETVTLRHLLTHTSGLSYDKAQAFIDERMASDLEMAEASSQEEALTKRYLTAGYSLVPSKSPGSEMSYCNYNYTLLAEVVRRVSGQSFWDFARQRIFEPLGMQDSWYRCAEGSMGRVAHLDPAHPPDVGVVIDDSFEKEIFDGANGAWGLKSTSADYAIFVQMILNGGSYGDARLLHPRTISEMTRNQIPGIGTDFFGTWHPEAFWGLGFRIVGDERWSMFDGSLTPKGSYMHGGAGGTEWWADPTDDLLGIYCSVCLDIDYERRETRMNFDLMQDMVTAAVVD